jgi:hypothetical protein
MSKSHITNNPKLSVWSRIFSGLFENLMENRMGNLVGALHVFL